MGKYFFWFGQSDLFIALVLPNWAFVELRVLLLWLIFHNALTSGDPPIRPEVIFPGSFLSKTCAPPLPMLRSTGHSLESCLSLREALRGQKSQTICSADWGRLRAYDQASSVRAIMTEDDDNMKWHSCATTISIQTEIPKHTHTHILSCIPFVCMFWPSEGLRRS